MRLAEWHPTYRPVFVKKPERLFQLCPHRLWIGVLRRVTFKVQRMHFVKIYKRPKFLEQFMKHLSQLKGKVEKWLNKDEVGKGGLQEVEKFRRQKKRQEKERKRLEKGR